MTDFDAADHGSIIILRPISAEARDWVDDYIPDDAQWFGHGVAIEPRYFADIHEAIVSDGLTIA